MSSKLQSILRSKIHLLPKLPIYKLNALKHIAVCRTKEEGIIVRNCTDCDHIEKRPKSCGSRYCNQCGNHEQVEWVEKRMDEILPVQYAMITFTIPHHLLSILNYNEKLFYQIFFDSVSESLNIAMKEKYGNSSIIGFISVLHTWNQKLNQHPHIHVIIPCGALAEDHMEWYYMKKKYLLSDKLLKDQFRRLFCDKIIKARSNKKLNLPPSFNHDLETYKFYRFLRGEYKRWVIDISITQKRAETAIDYLGRYVNKTAISDERIEKYSQDEVTIRTKDRNTGIYEKIKMSSMEFLNRFLKHILPKGMTRFRYYGFLSCRYKKYFMGIFDQIFEFKDQAISPKRIIKSIENIFRKEHINQCPCCEQGHMQVVSIIQGEFGKMKEALYGSQ